MRNVATGYPVRASLQCPEVREPLHILSAQGLLLGQWTLEFDQQPLLGAIDLSGEW
jgi:hypothetical protein